MCQRLHDQDVVASLCLSTQRNFKECTRTHPHPSLNVLHIDTSVLRNVVFMNLWWYIRMLYICLGIWFLRARNRKKKEQQHHDIYFQGEKYTENVCDVFIMYVGMYRTSYTRMHTHPDCLVHAVDNTIPTGPAVQMRGISPIPGMRAVMPHHRSSNKAIQFSN